MLSIPTATTPKAKGAFPEDHPLALGVLGMCGSLLAESYMKSGETDVLLVIGASLNQTTTLSWDPRLKPSRCLLHINIDPTARYIMADGHGYLCPIHQTAVPYQRYYGTISGRQFPSHGSSRSMPHGQQPEGGDQRIRPTKLHVVHDPTKGIPSINEEDGVFRQSFLQLLHHALPKLGLVHELQRFSLADNTVATTFKEVNFAKVAEGLGAVGHRISKPGELKKLLPQAIASRKPTGIDCLIDPKEVPPLAPFVEGMKNYTLSLDLM